MRRFGIGLLGLLTTVALWPAADSQAAFPGDNGRIAYSAEPPGGGLDGLWTVNPDGSQPLQLSGGLGGIDPDYSADGSRIAFMRAGDLMVMSSAGGTATKLFDGTFDFENGVTWEEDFEDPETEEIVPVVKIVTLEQSWDKVEGPAFSPDGSSLAIERELGLFQADEVCAVESVEDETCIPSGEPGYYSKTFVECSCGSELVSISATTGAILADLVPPNSLDEERDPVYSSDGKLAFIGREVVGPEVKAGHYVVPSPGVAAQLILPERWRTADFSPDGSKLVTLSQSLEDLLIFDAANGALVSTIPAPSLPGIESVELWDPKFSPDGTKIAFEYEGDPESGPRLERVFTIGLDGGGLTTVIEDVAEFAWQPIPRPAPPTAAAPIIAKGPVQAKASSKKRVKLDRKGRGTIGWVVCGSSPCAASVISSKLKVGKRGYWVKARAPKRLAAGKRGKLRVKVKGNALAALKKKGKGRLTTRVRAGNGLKPLKLRSSVVPKRRGKRKPK